MRCDRMIEVRLFNDQGLPTTKYDIDVSTNLMSKRWPKLVYRILKECITTCMMGGVCIMRGTLVPKD